MIDTLTRQRPEASLFVGNYANQATDGFELQDGSDLYIETYKPDDILVLEARLEMNRSREDVLPAVMVADKTLLAIMNDFYEADEDFHIHEKTQDGQELREFVMGVMRRQIAAECGPETMKYVSDQWLADRLSFVRGFPPYSYEEDLPETA